MRNFKTPKPSELKAPILEILSDGKVWIWKSIVDEVAGYFNLTQADRRGDLFPNGQDRLRRYVSNTLVNLEKAGLVKRRDDFGHRFLFHKKNVVDRLLVREVHMCCPEGNGNMA